MKIFLLVVLILLLISRIKNTPSMLSKNLYQLKTQKSLDKTKNSNTEQTEEQKLVFQGVVISVVLLLQVFLFIFYIMTGSKIGTPEMYILSALQAVTTVKTTYMTFSEGDKLFSDNVEDYKFHRWYFMFNIVLDYIYYPLAIYMLLK